MFFMESTSQDLRYIQIICILSILHIDRHTQRERFIYINTHIYVHIEQLMKKGSINLNKSKERYLGRFGKKKDNVKMM